MYVHCTVVYNVGSIFFCTWFLFKEGNFMYCTLGYNDFDLFFNLNSKTHLFICFIRGSANISQNQCCGSGRFIPDPGSWLLPIPDPGSRIPDPKTATKERSEKKFHKIENYFSQRITGHNNFSHAFFAPFLKDSISASNSGFFIPIFCKKTFFSA